MIVIADYGMGNLESIKNMMKKVGYKSVISADLEVIRNAGLLILPGVGHFGKAMQLINSHGLREVLDDKIKNHGTPLLGICLGMQLLLNHSEEGDSKGLGYIDGEVKKFQFAHDELKVPHMGWNEVSVVTDNNVIQENNGAKPRYYFVHSYYAKCANEQNVLGRTVYGFEFDCAIQNKNVTGVQFHPEKSHKYGMEFFRNYLKENDAAIKEGNTGTNS